jgi:PhoH-like ATPase
MTRKTFVIDTNVLLHDPEAIERFVGNDVVVCLAIMEELDKMKHFTDELGKNARSVIRYIDSVTKGQQLNEGISLPNDINLRIIVDIKHGSEKKAFPLSLDRAKNKVLLIAHHLQDRGEHVVIVSKDLVMRVKSQAIGIDAEDYESMKEPYKHLYKGMITQEIDKATLDQFFLDGKFVVPNHEGIANQFCQMKTPDGQVHLSRYNHKVKHFEPLLKLSRDVWGIQPLNTEQRCALDLLLRDDIKLITLIGQAGTGKTLLALACGMKKIFDDNVYSRLLISRPIMPLGKDIGFLPGTKEEKLYHWMQPIFDNLKYLCEETSGSEDNGQETKKWIMESNKIEMEAVTYIRGRSLSKMYVIIDEAQNLTPHEIKTIISRAGHGTKIILTGDPTQIDNPYLDKDSNALTYIVNRFKNQPIYGHMFLETTERSHLSALAAELL